MTFENIDSREGFSSDEELAYGWNCIEGDDPTEDDLAEMGEYWAEDMDGDFDSAMRDAGFGTDEDYGYYGEDY